MTTPGRPSPLLRVVLRAPLRLYDWPAGWLLGHRFLRLTHIGRRSGRRYHTVVEVPKTDPTTREVMVMSGFGPTTDWLRNIQANPAFEITIGRCHFTAVRRILDESDAAVVLADYERHNRRIAPIVRRVLRRLIGWTYDGTGDARHRVVHELPVIAFRPPPPVTSDHPPLRTTVRQRTAASRSVADCRHFFDRASAQQGALLLITARGGQRCRTRRTQKSAGWSGLSATVRATASRPSTMPNGTRQ